MKHIEFIDFRHNMQIVWNERNVQNIEVSRFTLCGIQLNGKTKAIEP